MAFVAFIMIGIGIYQLKSDKPVGFYSGVEPPKPEELTDVRGWNVRHGAMWVIYGGVIIVTSVFAALFLSGLWCPLLMTGGVMLPIPALVLYHLYLEKRYLK